jgi:hypothetical protein
MHKVGCLKHRRLKKYEQIIFSDTPLLLIQSKIRDLGRIIIGITDHEKTLRIRNNIYKGKNMHTEHRQIIEEKY